MEFRVVYYEDQRGRRPVREFFNDVRRRQPVLYLLIRNGLKKLSLRANHRPPLTKAIGDGLFELRLGGADTVRVLWFFVAGAKIVLVHGFVKKGERIPQRERETALTRMREYLSRHRWGE